MVCVIISSLCNKRHYLEISNYQCMTSCVGYCIHIIFRIMQMCKINDYVSTYSAYMYVCFYESMRAHACVCACVCLLQSCYWSVNSLGISSTSPSLSFTHSTLI